MLCIKTGCGLRTISIRRGLAGYCLTSLLHFITGLERASSCLLRKGADVNAEGYYLKWSGYRQGSTALQGSISGEFTAREGSGCQRTSRTAWQSAAHLEGAVQLFGYFLRMGRMRGVLRILASFGEFNEIVLWLLEKGADVNAQGGGLGTALQTAAFREDYRIIRLLLEKGAYANHEKECLADGHLCNQGRQFVHTTNCTSTACQEAKVCYMRSGSPPTAARNVGFSQAES
ncbi:hypothetical protein JB92DRAFT_2064995 [Gautieria morchelliformis]|nr:hypothetical protein JB92DRAFT_2064995 [Gautieria morchelliformis]